MLINVGFISNYHLYWDTVICRGHIKPTRLKAWILCPLTPLYMNQTRLPTVTSLHWLPRRLLATVRAAEHLHGIIRLFEGDSWEHSIIFKILPLDNVFRAAENAYNCLGCAKRSCSCRSRVIGNKQRGYARRKEGFISRLCWLLLLIWLWLVPVI